jgi:hypothetical protein
VTDTPKGVSVPTLTVTGGPHDGVSLLFKEIPAIKVLGSGPDCALRTTLANIAPRHAKLSADSRGLTVEDLQSETGTFVNGERLGRERVLEQGDRLCLGPPGSKASVKLLVRLPEGPFSWGTLLATEAPPLPPLILLEPTPPPPMQGDPTTASAVSAPPPPAAPPPPEPRKARPDYTDELPSITPEKPREGGDAVPPPPPRSTTRITRDRKPAKKEIPRAAIYGGAAFVALLVVYLLFGILVKPAAVITSVMPPRVQEGQALTINGSGFGSGATGNVVHFGDLAGKVVQATETTVIATAPIVPTGGSATYNVTVEAHGRKSNVVTVMVYSAPRISAVEPDAGLPGDTILVRGAHLEGKGLTILAGGIPADLIDAQGTQARFKLPDVPVPVGKDVAIVAQLGGESSPATYLTVGHLPIVKSVTPSQAQAGEPVTLAGKGFDAGIAENQVTFEGEPSLILSASPTQIVVSTPSLGLDSLSHATLVVQSKAGKSAGRAFLVTRPSSGSYVPHFFAAPVPDHPSHDHIFVANELAPFFLLTGKADAPSTIERALGVAKALNSLLSQSRTSLPQFEIREKPIVALAVAGSPASLVTVTPEDAAAYDEGWGVPSSHGKRTPQALAAFWMALLQDETSLFVLHQRPTRLMAVTARGKILSDLFSEAAHRGSSDDGVPMSLLSPFQTVSKQFRDLALIPGEGGTATAALEGTWSGTWDDTGSGTKDITVRFSVKGAKLDASLTTTAGGLAMDVPLTGVSFDKDVVRFVFASGGQERHFSGTLEGNGLAGTVQIGGKEAGKFALHFNR